MDVLDVCHYVSPRDDAACHGLLTAAKHTTIHKKVPYQLRQSLK